MSKISNGAAPTLPLTNTELIPLVQGGVNKTATVAQLFSGFGDYVDQLAQATVDSAESAVDAIVNSGVSAIEVFKTAASLSAIAAALSAAAAEAVVGPTYPSNAAGLAATSEGGSFAVDNGDGTVKIYQKVSGAAVLQRRLATTEALFATSGSLLIGHGSETLASHLDANTKRINFADIATTPIRSGVTRLCVKDRSGMIMKRFGGDPGALYPTYLKTQDASGAWWIFDIEVQSLRAGHFGIVQEPWGTFGGPNEHAKIQAFVQFPANVPLPCIPDMTVEARVDAGIDANPVTGEWKTKVLSGVMRLRGGAYVTNRYSIDIGPVPNYFHWEGGIIHSAFGSSAYSLRQNWGGIVLRAVSRGYIAILHSSFNIAHAVKATKLSGENANLFKIGRVGGNYNGCGFDFASTKNTVVIPNSRTPYGTASSADQRTRLGGFTLAQLPHEAIDLYVHDLGANVDVGSAQRTDSVFIHFPSQGLRKVTYVDRTNGAIGVYPAVTSAVVGETADFIYGSAFSIEGADANIFQVDVLEGSINGTILDDNGFYGSTFSETHGDGTGLGITGGQRYSAGTKVTTILQSYVEVASWGELVPMSVGKDIKIVKQVSGYDYPFLVNLLDPVDHTTGARAGGAAGIGQCEVTIGDTTFNNRGNRARYYNSFTLKLGGKNPPDMHTSGNATITIVPVMPTFQKCVEELGARALEIFVHGDGAGGAPSGTVTINAIAGYSFNGGSVNTAYAVPLGGPPTKPTNINIWLVEETKNFIVMTTHAA